MKTKYIILSAPSGSGKSTIAFFLLNEIESLSFSVSSTNRKKRKNENEGIDYYFISREKFKSHIESDDFIEWEEVYINHYKGTLKSEIDRLIKEKRNIIFDVDVSGGINLKKYFGNNALSVFIDVPNLEILKNRLLVRGSENHKSLIERIEKSKSEIKMKDEFDVVFMSARNKGDISNLRDLLYERVKELHVKRYPYNKFLY